MRLCLLVLLGRVNLADNIGACLHRRGIFAGGFTLYKGTGSQVVRSCVHASACNQAITEA